MKEGFKKLLQQNLFWAALNLAVLLAGIFFADNFHSRLILTLGFTLVTIGMAVDAYTAGYKAGYNAAFEDDDDDDDDNGDKPAVDPLIPCPNRN